MKGKNRFIHKSEELFPVGLFFEIVNLLILSKQEKKLVKEANKLKKLIEPLSGKKEVDKPTYMKALKGIQEDSKIITELGKLLEDIKKQDPPMRVGRKLVVDDMFLPTAQKLISGLSGSTETISHEMGIGVWPRAGIAYRNKFSSSIEVDLPEETEFNIFSIKQEVLSNIENKLLLYERSGEMEEFEGIGTSGYDCEVDIFIDDDKNRLIQGREHCIDVSIGITDTNKREALLETFFVLFYTNNLDITEYDHFHKFEFCTDNKASCQFKVTPKELGKSKFRLEFYQNAKLFYKKEFNINIVSSEYAL